MTEEARLSSVNAEPRGRRGRAISVALCTCDGERFLGEQLGSIAAQTRLPDELVVVDDRSSDGTVAIARRFADEAPFGVRVEVNERRLGPTKNFERAIGHCRGDFISLCDQDDVWVAERLAALERSLAEAPDAGLVFSDAEVVDERLLPLGYGFWSSISFTARERRLFDAGRAFEVLLRHTIVSGSTALFRASARDVILPIPETWMHDAWIALMISARSRLLPVDAPLSRYRQHAANEIGGRRRGAVERAARSLAAGPAAYDLAAAQFEEARERLLERPDAIAPGLRDRSLRLLDEKIAHMRRRALIGRSGLARVPMVLEELAWGRYHRYSNGMQSCWRDLLAPARRETGDS